MGGGAGTIALPSPARRRPRRPEPARRTVRLPRVRLPHVAAPDPAALARRTGAFVVSLPESSLLDRVIRGRIWIPLLGVLLVGIVAMQVEILKLNAGIGAAIEQTTTLQSRNDALRESVTGLSNEQRIETIAARHGMVMAPPTSVKFLHAGGSGYVPAAVRNIHAPGSTSFTGPVGTASAAAAAASSGSSTTPVGG
jgi:cell division protein FtsL